MSESDEEMLIQKAIAAFNEVITASALDEFARTAALAIALDGLVSAYNATTDHEPDEGADAPRGDFPSLLRQIGPAFPSLGSYPDVDTLDGFDQEIGTGDAIDDIADIARDLADVLWYFDQRRPATAIWEYRFGYQSHWGQHLHDLRRFLHRRLT